MAEPDDKKELLDTTENGHSYGSSSSSSSDLPPTEDAPKGNKIQQFLYEHRKSIPGYGTAQLIRKAEPYALYVLFALLVAYLLNQLDRYTLPVVTSTVGAELEYGDKACRANPDLKSYWLDASNTSLTRCPYYNNTPCDNITDVCTKDKYRGVTIL